MKQSMLRDRMAHEPERFIAMKRKDKMTAEQIAAQEKKWQLQRNKSWAADDFHASGW